MPPPSQTPRTARAAQPPRRQPPLDHARNNAYRDHRCLRAPRAALPPPRPRERREGRRPPEPDHGGVAHEKGQPRRAALTAILTTNDASPPLRPHYQGRGTAGPPDDLVDGARTVGVGCVEEPDPLVYGSAQDLDRAGHVFGSPTTPGPANCMAPYPSRGTRSCPPNRWVATNSSSVELVSFLVPSLVQLVGSLVQLVGVPPSRRLGRRR